TTEIAPLLRYRLRIATLITLAAFAVYLVRNFLAQGEEHGPTALGLAIHSSVVAVMIFLACVLWTTYPLSVRALRTIELTLFGVAALFFIYLHFVMFTDGHVLQWARPGYEANVASLAIATGNLRWFVLIVLYGTFVPNTWNRCATVVGLLAAVPLMLNLWMSVKCPFMSPVTGPSPMLDSLILLGLGATIAIFGSYKISVLQQEAVVARELGQYRLRQKLGSGGMGEVYLAEHVMLRRKCALKLIRSDQTADPTNLQRFEREVQAMATLTHPNTVEVYD